MMPCLAAKAGMEGLDKASIEAVIEKASQGSAFYAHRKKKEARLQERVAAEKLRLESFTPLHIAQAQAQAEEVVGEMESGRVLGETLVHVDMDAFYAAVEARDDPSLRTVPMMESGRVLGETLVHVDMDAFYAAVEARDDPSLRTVPMAVGSSAMLSTSNYAARRFGVRAAMPGFIARKLCPHLKIVPCHFDKYKAVSRVVQGVLEEYDPGYSMGSLDEAYLNITDFLRRRTGSRIWPRIRYHGPCQCALPRAESSTSETGSVMEESCLRCHQIRLCVTDEVEFGPTAEDVVNEMRFRVQQETCGLTCSAGIASNTLLAKIASDMRKPNGQFIVPEDPLAIRDFLADLPTRKVSGIGGVTEAMLRGVFGIEKVGQIMEHCAILFLSSSSIHFRSLIAVALGLGSTQFSNEREQKSVSVEQTFSSLSGKEEQAKMVEELCDSLAGDLASKGLRGRTVTLKAKLADFTLRTRSLSFPNPITSAQELQTPALQLLESLRSEHEGKLDLRLLGVRLSAFNAPSSKPAPQSLGIAAFLSSPSKPGPSTATDTDSPNRQGRSEDDGNEGAVKEEKGDDGNGCPVCGEGWKTENEASRQRHVEDCLSRQAIKDILAAENSTTKSEGGRKRGRPSGTSRSTSPRKKSRPVPVRPITAFFASSSRQ